MAFCNQCGASVPDGTILCAKCESAPKQTVIPNETDAMDAAQNGFMAVLAYIGILVFIPIFAAPRSPFARYHCVQGFNLFLLMAAEKILFAILRTLRSLVLAFGVPFWSPINFVSILDGIITLGVVAFSILGIVNAVQGNKKELPIIGKLRFLDALVPEKH